MHRRAVTGLTLMAMVAGVPATAAHAGGEPVAHAACQQARIGGQSKCIGRGQYCAKAKQSDYRKYGFSCSKRDARGRYHLQ